MCIILQAAGPCLIRLSPGSVSCTIVFLWKPPPQGMAVLVRYPHPLGGSDLTQTSLNAMPPCPRWRGEGNLAKACVTQQCFSKLKTDLRILDYILVRVVGARSITSLCEPCSNTYETGVHRAPTRTAHRHEASCLCVIRKMFIFDGCSTQFPSHSFCWNSNSVWVWLKTSQSLIILTWNSKLCSNMAYN